jgi:hypothetical protein
MRRTPWYRKDTLGGPGDPPPAVCPECERTDDEVDFEGDVCEGCARITWLEPAEKRDPTSIASILRWVTANHLAAARAEHAKLFGESFDTAYTTARMLGIPRDTITNALRNV